MKKLHNGKYMLYTTELTTLGDLYTMQHEFFYRSQNIDDEIDEKANADKDIVYVINELGYTEEVPDPIPFDMDYAPLDYVLLDRKITNLAIEEITNYRQLAETQKLNNAVKVYDEALYWLRKMLKQANRNIKKLENEGWELNED